VVTWALGTASGVLLGLFGVQLVSSRFSTTRVSPLSHPEVLRALQAARSVPGAPDGEVALPLTAAPGTAVPPPSPPTDAASARPSAEATSSPAQASPASSLPRPGATAGILVDPAAGAAATPPSSTITDPPEPEPPSTSTSATTATTEKKSKSDSKNSGNSSTTSSSTASTAKKTTTTSGPAPQTPRQAQPTTITCTGGIVTVRYSGGKVDLKAARPNSGYQVYVPEQRSPDEVVVYFYNNNTAYQVRAFYTNGSPDYKVTKYQWSSRKGQG